MGAFRPLNGSLLCALAIALATAACGERPAAKKSDITPEDVIAGAAVSLDHFESPEGRFGLDLPPVWKGNYTGTPHADTTYGSRFYLDLRFKPDASMKVEPRTLMVVRIFTPAAWAKVTAKKGPAIGIKLTERGDNVYVVSLAGSNPYKPGTPAAELFDKMMLAVVNAAPRLTPH